MPLIVQWVNYGSDSRAAQVQMKTAVAEFKREWAVRYGETPLCFEWEILEQILDRQVATGMVREVKMLVVRDSGGLLVAAVPFMLCRSEGADCPECIAVDYQQRIPWDMVGEEEFIHFLPMILPEYLAQVLPSFPYYLSYDWGYSYTELFDAAGFPTISYPLIEVKPLDQYIEEGKNRKEWARIIRKNSDLQVERITSEQFDVLCESSTLFSDHIEYTKARDATLFTLLDKYEVLNQGPELVLGNIRRIMKAAGSRFVGLLFSLNSVPIAVNLSTMERGVLCDYLTLRSLDPLLKPRSLGTLAILKNIELAHELGCHQYDLGITQDLTEYKRQFLTTERQQLLIGMLSPALLYRNFVGRGLNGYPFPYKSWDGEFKYLNSFEETVKELQMADTEYLRIHMKGDYLSKGFLTVGDYNSCLLQLIAIDALKETASATS